MNNEEMNEEISKFCKVAGLDPNDVKILFENAEALSERLCAAVEVQTKMITGPTLEELK